MNSFDRRDYLDALGLVDWAYRTAASEDDSQAAQPPVATDTVEPTQTSHAADEPAPSGSASGEAQPRQAGKVAATKHSPADMDWDELQAWLAAQDYRGATQPVFGVGARNADLLIVGEAPGANEDARGEPFVGRAGKLLDRMLFAIGLSRQQDVYITNICKFRPPGNRDPKPGEVAADWPVLERQIDLIQPKLVVAVGCVAAQTLLDTTESLGELRGRPHGYPRRDLDVLVTYHPAYLLRSPQQKSKAWEDLKQIAGYLRHLKP